MSREETMVARGLALCVAMLMAAAGLTGTLPREGKMHLVERAEVSGQIGERLSLTTRRLLSDYPYSERLVLEDVTRRRGYDRRFEEYEGDVSGRYIGALAKVARLRGLHLEKLTTVAQRVLDYQAPDGHFGLDQSGLGWEEWRKQLWGHGRLLVGLVEVYSLTQDPRFLDAAQRLAEYLVNGIPRWPLEQRQHRWFTDFTSLLESLMTLYAVDPDSQWLNAAQAIAELVPQFGHYHAHGYLISLVGMAKLARVSGDRQLLDRLTAEVWRNFVRGVLFPDGSVPEWLPQDKRTEGCAIVDWLRLTLAMWELTGEAAYLDLAEKTALNGLAFHQTANGAFGHAHVIPTGYQAPYSEAWWCCLPHGLVGYVDFVRHAFVAVDDTLFWNFYFPLKAELSVSGQKLSLVSETDFPNTGVVKLNIRAEDSARFVLSVRCPAWAPSVAISVNGAPVQTSPQHGWLRLHRTWADGDSVVVTFPLKLRFEDRRGNAFDLRLYETNELPDLQLWCGPVMLVQSERWNRKLRSDLYVRSLTDLKHMTVFGEEPFLLPELHFSLNTARGKVIFNPISEATGGGRWTKELQNFIPTGEKPINRHPVRWSWRVWRE